MKRARTLARGFTLIELVVTLTLVSILAMVAVPLYEVTVTRMKESELRTALRQIRSALDAYKAAADQGIISKGAADSGYPPNLALLVQGVDTIASPIGASSIIDPGNSSTNGAPGMNSGNAPATGGGFGTPSAGSGGPAAQSANPNAIPTHMVFLRQLPRDPFFSDQTVAPDQQWNLRAYGAPPDDFSSGADVYDVSTKSTLVGSNGVAYKDW